MKWFASSPSTRRPSMLAAGFLAVGLALTGCAAPTSGDGGGNALPPVIADLTKIDGTTVTVVEGNVIDLVGDDEDYLDWKAEIDDEAIVSFTPGKDDGSAQFNPGLTAKKVGETDVVLSNDASGDEVAFTVEVTPKK
ncbi:hypothetical protein LTA6_003373 [Microbacterium sp. LTA6]|uniref:hypothetical protein n=1 Tax=unclassified Microbacterium TaxID=2609290 RepID=UPI003139C36D